jgi:3-oxoacyl-[acyl-carrier-protein] synthase II
VARRVVVTGMGMITSLGHTVQDTWEGILAGKSGVKKITHFDASSFSSQISSSVQAFDPSPYFSPKEARKTDLFIQYGMAAGAQAMEDSGLEVTEELGVRFGVAVGSGIGGLPFIEKCYQVLSEKGARRMSPFFIPAVIINMVAGNLSIRYGLKGPNISAVTACTTGTHNIGLASRMIRYGDADVMLCGGSEMATCPLGIGGFSALRALSTRNDAPELASRPWDKDRDGFILADGAGVLVLEEYEHAKKRGAKIYAELLGVGMSADASHITSPDPEGAGAARCMAAALADAGINSDVIDYINAHGTSTQVGDELELKGVKKQFGDHAYQLAISSTKSMTGHLLGAAGAIEAIFSILALRDQVAPATVNLESPSEGCDLDLVPGSARQMKLEVVLSNSFGFGGTNGSLIFKRFDTAD